ncbi:MAG: S8 family serine peptidase [Patescibacteria group bacterium]|nr:S8 family serine peptidase [Patescibacteria group bacterium]
MYRILFLAIASLVAISSYFFTFSTAEASSGKELVAELKERGVVPVTDKHSARLFPSPHEADDTVSGSAVPLLPEDDAREGSLSAEINLPEKTSQSTGPDLIIGVSLPQLTDSDRKELLDGVAETIESGGSMEFVIQKSSENIYIVSYASPLSIDELRDRFENSNAIKVVENRVYTPHFSSNDPFSTLQYNLDTIRYQEARVTIGSITYNPVIAVMDNGVNVTDPEITGQLWTNPGEIPENGVDDDVNGYIDDVHGCNFLKQRSTDPLVSAASCQNVSLYSSGSNHGTQVAQIAAAKTENAVGIAGVCPHCRIMVLDVDDAGSASLIDIINAIVYASNNGADVINFSYASTCPFDETADILNDLLVSTSNSGVSWVQAAGNHGARTQEECTQTCGTNSYCNSNKRNQAFYYIDGKNAPNTFIVAATDSTGKRSSFSNYDADTPVITIAAPGSNIPVYTNGVLVNVSGTSFAAPHVSGAIGFALGYTKPGYTPPVSVLRNFMRNTAKRITTDFNISSRLLNLGDFAGVMNAEGRIFGTNRLYVSRFYSDSRRAHFFTGNPAEASVVRDTLVPSIYRFEGIAFFAYANQVDASSPVFRFYNTNTRSHFYTINAAEKEIVRTQLAKDGWTYEGIGFYVYPVQYSGPDTITVYRFYNLATRRHFFTTNVAEKDLLIANFPQNNWRYEGEAWKAIQ